MALLRRSRCVAFRTGSAPSKCCAGLRDEREPDASVRSSALRSLIAIAIAIALAAASDALADESSRCPRDKAMKADLAAADVQSWRELFNAYLDYAVCDDAAIAEGFSDSVGRLLSADTVRWSELASFVKTDDGFLGFVVRHIDATVPATMVDSIEQNAREKCPESARNICQTVLKGCKDLRTRVKQEQGGGR